MLVVGIDAFGLLQFRADDGRDGGHDGFDEDLEEPVDGHHGEERRGAPEAEERERVEDQAVDALPDDGRTDEAGPGVASAHAHLHLGEDVRVEEVADAEGHDGTERNPPTATEAGLERRLELRAEGFVRASRQRQDHPGHDRGEEQRAEARPDDAAGQGVAIDLGEDVAEDVGQREEEVSGAELRRSQQGQVQHDDLGWADEVRAEQHGDEGP